MASHERAKASAYRLGRRTGQPVTYRVKVATPPATVDRARIYAVFPSSGSQRARRDNAVIVEENRVRIAALEFGERRPSILNPAAEKHFLVFGGAEHRINKVDLDGGAADPVAYLLEIS